MRLLIRIVAIAVLVALASLALLGVPAPWSPSGWFLLGTSALAAVALLVREGRARRGLVLVAFALLVILLVVRMVGANEGMITMRTLPGGEPARWLARLVDEQDLTRVGARVLAMRERLPPVERDALLPAVRWGYQQVRRDDAVFPSPVLDTLFGRQAPAAFDTLVIEPRAQPKPGVPMKFGVVFLHGYAGSFTLECWLMARAAREIGALTVCPATDYSGRWPNEAGLRIVRAALAYLRSRGIERVFLAGLSNGAAGALGLLPQVASSFQGVILISGAPAAGDVGEVPTLVVHGSVDTMTPAPAARAFAERVKATYAEFDGGHFVWLTRPRDTREAIVDWLMRQTGYHVRP